MFLHHRSDPPPAASIMRVSFWALSFVLTPVILTANAVDVGLLSRDQSSDAGKTSACPEPKVIVVNLYDQEGESFFNLPNFNIHERNITVPGLSPLFPDVHCTADYSLCELIAGEGEINAATSITALSLSPLFNLSKTYWIIAGVGGIDPTVTTIGSVTFPRFAVQIDLQYAFDLRDLPDNFTTGFVPQGSHAPDEYPAEIYGTEVFELNQNLRDLAMSILKDANIQLNDTAGAQAYRALFHDSKTHAAAAAPPSVVACDTITSNIYYSGALLNDAFRNYTSLITNGTGRYCMSQQEDNAVLEALMRADLADRTDFSRILILRTASDFLPPPPGVSAAYNLFYGQDGYEAALNNLPIAGAPIIQKIVGEWEQTFGPGVKPGNYVGDILGSLGGTPDFGPGKVEEPEVLQPLSRRGAEGGAMLVGRRVGGVKGRGLKRRSGLPAMRLARH